jgi:hypothetical protein
LKSFTTLPKVKRQLKNLPIIGNFPLIANLLDIVVHGKKETCQLNNEAIPDYSNTKETEKLNKSNA